MYTVSCFRCSDSDFECSEIHAGQKCPKCGREPNVYRLDDQEYCWLHQCRLSEEYLLAENWLFIHWGWRNAFDLFPNAKLYETHGLPTGKMRGYACPECQSVYEEWLGRDEDDSG